MVVPTSETAPLVTAATAVIVGVVPSGSESFVKSSDAAISLGVSSAVVSTDAFETVVVSSSVASGASAIGSIVSVAVAELLVSPLAVTVYVKDAEPL